MMVALSAASPFSYQRPPLDYYLLLVKLGSKPGRHSPTDLPITTLASRPRGSQTPAGGELLVAVGYGRHARCLCDQSLTTTTVLLSVWYDDGDDD